MALLKFDSFDGYATADIVEKHPTSVITVGGTVITVDSSGGQSGTRGLKYSYAGNNGTLYVRGGVVASGSTAIIGCAFKFDALSGGGETRNGIISVYSSSGIQCCVCVTDAGELRVRRGDATGTSLGVSTTAFLATGAWYYIEFKVVLATTATGSFEVRVNNTNVISGSSVTTATTVSTWNGYGLIANTGNLPLASPWYLDDLYVCDGSGGVNDDFLGPVRALARFPNGVGASSDFSPASNNYQKVYETTPDDDTTYVSCSTPGDHDTYAFEALGVTGTIKGVQTNMVVRSDGAGSETVRPRLLVGGNPYNGATVNVSTTYQDKTEVFQVSPDSGVAWTPTEFDASEFGQELVS